MSRFPWFRRKDEEKNYEGMERRGGNDRRALTAREWLKRTVLFVFVHLPWAILCFVGRLTRRFLVTIGFTALVATIGFVYATEIMNWVDNKYTSLFDAQLGTDRASIARLSDPNYYAEETGIVSEELTQVACISSPEHRVLIADPGEVPDLFKKAIIASEDQTFYEHEGVDQYAILRAVIQRARGVSKSGASTLPMQTAKHLRGGTGHRSTMTEKVQDAIMALRIEREFSKGQIMLRYVNMPFLGRGYGIEAASRAYFGKPAKDLALHQVAFIVSLIPKPRVLERSFASNPSIKDPQKIADANWAEAVRGTRRVLDNMHDEGYITEVEHDRANELIYRSLRKEVLPRKEACGANKYYVEHVRQEVSARGHRVDSAGLQVYIPRDDGIENVTKIIAEKAIEVYTARHKDDEDNHLLRAGGFVMQFNGDMLALVGNADFKRIKYDVITQGWRQPGSTFKPIVYTALAEQLLSEILAEENPPQTIEEIVAELNKRCTVLDEPVGVSLGRGRGVKMIQNFASNSEPRYRGNISCKLAIGESRNAAAIRAGKRADIKRVIELAYRLGMPKDEKHMLQPYPTTAIGGSEVNPLGMAGMCAFVNGGFKCEPRFVNDVCKFGKSLLFKQDDGRPRDCDIKGELRKDPERVIHPAVATLMVDILQGPLDGSVMQKNRDGKLVEYFGGTARSLRTGVIPGLDPLSPAVWNMPPDEKKKRILAFPIEKAGEIACKTGTATNADGRTSDVWLICFVPGPEANPEKGVMFVFWMGKDSKERPLGDRGTGTTKGFAESGGRNWVPLAGLLLDYLQKERGLLKPGNKFRPIYQDEVLLNFSARREEERSTTETEVEVVDPFDPNTPPELLKQIPPPEEPASSPDAGGDTSPEGMKD